MDISIAAFLKEQDKLREKNGTDEDELDKIEREYAEGHTKFRNLQVTQKQNISQLRREVKVHGFKNFQIFFVTYFYTDFRTASSRQVFSRINLYRSAHVRIRKALLTYAL